MSAPAEAEILALFDARQERFPQATNKLEEALAEFFDLIDYRPASADFPDEGELGNYIWTDLRHSEGDALRELRFAAEQRVKQATLALVRQELVAACQSFAALHPDAPRQQNPDLAA